MLMNRRNSLLMIIDVQERLAPAMDDPGHYAPGVVERLGSEHPRLFISGHSHILKVIYDKKYDLLHINPGAAGLHGFHPVRTAVRFTLRQGRIEDLEVGEWPRRY